MRWGLTMEFDIFGFLNSDLQSKPSSQDTSVCTVNAVVSGSQNVPQEKTGWKNFQYRDMFFHLVSFYNYVGSFTSRLGNPLHVYTWCFSLSSCLDGVIVRHSISTMEMH